MRNVSEGVTESLPKFTSIFKLLIYRTKLTELQDSCFHQCHIETIRGFNDLTLERESRRILRHANVGILEVCISCR